MKAPKMTKVCQLALASAIAAGSATAYGQTSVTLYGLVDTSIEYVNNMAGPAPTGVRGPADSRIAMTTGGIGGSRWGLRGTEDLGGNLKALFVLESGFLSDDGRLANSGRLFGRQAFVGLDSQYGKLTFGRQYSPVFDIFANYVPAAYAPQYEPLTPFLGRYFREDNAAKYSGNFGPLKVSALWSFGVDTTAATSAGEVPGNFRSGSAWGAAGDYTIGPVGLALAYDEVRVPTVAGGAPGKSQKASVGLHYAQNRLDVMAGYRWGRDRNAADVETQRDDFYWIGASYAYAGAFQSTLAYYYDDLKTVGSARSTVANPWQVTFITRYFLSKRTSLYLSTAYSKNASLNFDSAVGGSTYTLGVGKNSQFGAALGVRAIF